MWTLTARRQTYTLLGDFGEGPRDEVVREAMELREQSRIHGYEIISQDLARMAEESAKKNDLYRSGG